MSSSIRLQIEDLDEESLEVAEKELRETPENVEYAITELRKLLKNDPTLRFDDGEEYLKIILRPTKFYPESAYKFLKSIADFRKEQIDVLRDISPLAEKDAFLNTKVLNVLVDRDQKRRRILIMNIGSAWNPRELNTDHFFRLLYLIHFAATMEPMTQVHGTVIIMDFKGLGLSQAKAFSPAFSFRLLKFIQEAMPIRLKAVHIVFQPFIFKVIWKVFQPFIGAKLNKRIFFHGSDLKSLHKHVDLDCLPEEYGGTRGSIYYTSADWYPVLEKVEDKIIEWISFGYVDQ